MTENQELYQIKLEYITFEIVLENNIVIGTQLGECLLGMNLNQLQTWVNQRNGKIYRHGICC